MIFISQSQLFPVCKKEVVSDCLWSDESQQLLTASDLSYYFPLPCFTVKATGVSLLCVHATLYYMYTHFPLQSVVTG